MAHSSASGHERSRLSFTVGTDAYARHVGRYGAALSAAHADAAGVSAGDRALDVGCGPGALLAELARLLGADSVAAAEKLPFPAASFDVVLSQLVVNFLEDADAGVAEMRRVARRTVASCVWDYAGEMTMLRAFWDAALELDPDAPDEGRTMRYCTPDELAALWSRAGLRDVRTSPLVVEAEYADFDDYWSPFPSGIAPSGAYCASLDPDAREALRQACFRRLGSPAGRFALSARAWFVRGRV